jgi:hypothetical protein
MVTPSSLNRLAHHFFARSLGVDYFCFRYLLALILQTTYGKKQTYMVATLGATTVPQQLVLLSLRQLVQLQQRNAATTNIATRIKDLDMFQQQPLVLYLGIF